MLGRAGTKQCASKAKREGLHHNTVFSTNTHGVNVDLALPWTAVQHLTPLSYIHGTLEKKWDKESTAGCIFFAPCVRISSPKIGLVMFSHCLCQTLAKPLFLSGSLAVVLKKKRYQFVKCGWDAIYAAAITCSSFLIIRICEIWEKQWEVLNSEGELN